ncbi:MAG: 30S ribosome-binding factor RbfA [Ignavibacteria bacterium]|nr:30S ribosome-binding factor RbfA [Ignavibacteria bacterium]
MAYRVEKVAEDIKHKMNTAMSKDLSEINIGLVTISKVVLSPDLKNAKIYVTLLGNKESNDKCIDRLNFRKKHIRFMLGKQLSVKYIPDIHFYYDDTLDTAERVFKILNDLKKNENTNP